MSGYLPFFNPATGEEIQYEVTERETAGALTRYRWCSAPGGRIVAHLHPLQEEIFFIERGIAHFRVDGEERIARPGDRIVIPKGAVHEEWNSGPEVVTGFVELRPALRSRALHEALAGIAAEGKADGRGAPRNLLQLGAMFWAFRHDIRAVSPPVALQNLFLPLLAGIGRACGYRDYHERWDSRDPHGPSVVRRDAPGGPG